MKIEIVKKLFKNFPNPTSKKSSYPLYVVNPILIIVLGILAVSALAGLSGSKPKPPPEPSSTVASPSPTSTLESTPTLAPNPTVTTSPSPTSTLESPPTLAPRPTAEVKGTQAEEVLVSRVIDGDTIEIEGGKKVRYIGIDTPETVHPQKPIQCFGQEASNKNKELVEGKKVRLEKDISEIDKYGRLLRYVWVGDFFVNDYLVRQGYAQSSTYPPDVKYQDQFLQAQKEARENNRGLWGECSYFGEPKVKLTSTPAPQSQSGAYTCDCSKTCSQISSCEEAYFQLNTCGCSARDGDKDGIPCESLCLGGSQLSEPQPTSPLVQPTPPQSGGYTCNCSKTCDQISSCEEAYFQLNTCGCSARDGDKDGVPCEKLCR